MSQKNELSLAENILGLAITAALIYLLHASIQSFHEYTWAAIDKHFPSVSQYLKS